MKAFTKPKTHLNPLVLFFLGLSSLLWSWTSSAQVSCAQILSPSLPHMLRQSQQHMQSQRRQEEERLSQSIGFLKEKTRTSLIGLFEHPKSQEKKFQAIRQLQSDPSTAYLDSFSLHFMLGLLEQHVMRPRQALLYARYLQQRSGGEGPLSPTNMERAQKILSSYLIERGLLMTAKRIEEDPHPLNLSEAESFLSRIQDDPHPRELPPFERPPRPHPPGLVESKIQSLEAQISLAATFASLESI